ncbi:hypothetical protein [Haloarcula sp. CBA1127]|nr:hypothetical protein [Haloarcula sp. CBA1127]
MEAERGPRTDLTVDEELEFVLLFAVVLGTQIDDVPPNGVENKTQ